LPEDENAGDTEIQTLKRKLENPVSWLALAITVASSVIIYLTLLNTDASFESLNTTSLQIEIEQTRSEILKLDELLTASTLLYVNTREEQWQLKHDQYASDLDLVIEKSHQIAPEYIADFGISQTTSANNDLIKIETRAFDLVKRGELKAAQTLLAGDEYADNKVRYELSVARFSAPQDRWVRIAALAGSIEYYDAILTMSAKLFATTGNSYWEARYNMAAIKLDQAIEETLYLVDTEKLTQTLSKVDDANSKLIEMERQAISLAKDNNVKTAYKTLESDEYLNEKRQYATGMREFFGVITEQLSQSRDARTASQYQKMMLTTLSIAILIVSFFVVYRSIKKHQQELVVKNFQLEQLNEDLEQFAYRSSHDLKAPLSSIRGLATFVAQDINSGDLDEAVTNTEKISQLASKLESLIVDILELARADSAVETDENINLKELVSEIETKYHQQIEAKAITFSYRQETNDLLVTQRTRLTQILENLISNSIKYVNPAEAQPFITVSAYLVDRKNHISVKDNGPGIPFDLQKDVFTLFKRFHPDLAEGSGIGLSIIKKHIDRMGADIYLKSSPSGSEFTVVFPDNRKN